MSCVLLLALIAFVTAQPTTTGVQSSPSGSGGQALLQYLLYNEKNEKQNERLDRDRCLVEWQALEKEVHCSRCHTGRGVPGGGKGGERAGVEGAGRRPCGSAGACGATVKRVPQSTLGLPPLTTIELAFCVLALMRPSSPPSPLQAGDRVFKVLPSGSEGKMTPREGVPGAQCPTFVVFTAPDGCSSCSCSVDARLTDCTRSTCSDPGNYTINECVENALSTECISTMILPRVHLSTSPHVLCSTGNYTINECVENALYAGNDGCNSCQCNAFRSFSWCTRKICLLSDASSPQPLLTATQSPRSSSPSQAPPFTHASPLRPSRPPSRHAASPTFTSITDFALRAASGAPPQPPRRRGWTRRPAGSSTTREGLTASSRGRD
ncbi:Protein of unknown function [Gryllus bimaculatus]|nr:Protein of unknown function [Gryllus bimaculatus]